MIINKMKLIHDDAKVFTFKEHHLHDFNNYKNARSLVAIALEMILRTWNNTDLSKAQLQTM